VEIRRIDMPMWIAFGAAIPVTLAYSPLIAVTRTFDTHGLHPGLSAMPAFYATIFRTAIAPLLMAAVAAYVLARDHKKRENHGPVLPRYESAALVGFTIAPLFLLAARTFSKGLSFSERYVLFGVIGAAGLVAVLVFRFAHGNRRTGAVFAATLIAWLVLARGREAAPSTADLRTEFQPNNPLLLQALASGKPVVRNDPVIFLPADFYLPSTALANLYRVVNLAGATRYAGQDASDGQMLVIAEQFPIRARVEHWTSFGARHRHFLLLVNGPQRQRIYDMLLGDGAWRLTLQAQRGNETLYDVNSISEAAAP
jgi:hypothetical protein